MRRAFTLFELLITLALITILTTVTIIAVKPNEFKQKGRDNKVIDQMQQLEFDVNTFKLENGYYPDITPPSGVFYRQSGNTYEINAVLEYYVDMMTSDGGNNPNVYEIGNDLLLF
jgi:prepilin-type N-terminal cleavage/methylation domain-containing protein